MNNKNNRPSGLGVFISYAVMFAIVMLVVSFFFGNGNTQETKSLEFSEFVDLISNEKVDTLKISSSSRSYSGTLKDGTKFIAYAPTDYDMAIVSQEYVVPQAAEGKLKVESVKPSNWLSILSIIPTGILIVLMVIMMRNMNGANGKGVMSFGKSKARMVRDKDITFEQVAGLEEVKNDL